MDILLLRERFYEVLSQEGLGLDSEVVDELVEELVTVVTKSTMQALFESDDNDEEADDDVVSG